MKFKGSKGKTTEKVKSKTSAKKKLTDEYPTTYVNRNSAVEGADFEAMKRYKSSISRPSTSKKSELDDQRTRSLQDMSNAVMTIAESAAKASAKKGEPRPSFEKKESADDHWAAVIVSQMSRMDQGVKDKFMVSVLGMAMKGVAGLEF